MDDPQNTLSDLVVIRPEDVKPSSLIERIRDWLRPKFKWLWRTEPEPEPGPAGILVMPAIVVRPEDIAPDPVIIAAPVLPPLQIVPNETVPEQPDSEQDPMCPYCGKPLAGPLQICPYCKTPHHRECWTANRGCTTLGCRSAPRR